MFLLIVSLLCGHFIAVPNTTVNHAIYLSVAEIVHGKGKSTASVRIKVFTNDMEDAIMNEFGQKINLSDTSDFALHKKTIESYFQKHFQITIDGKQQVISLHHSSLVGDAVWFHFDLECHENWEEVVLKADYLMELFPTQSNVISLEHNSKKQFIRLTGTKKSDTLTF